MTVSADIKLQIRPSSSYFLQEVGRGLLATTKNEHSTFAKPGHFNLALKPY